MRVIMTVLGAVLESGPGVWAIGDAKKVKELTQHELNEILILITRQVNRLQ